MPLEFEQYSRNQIILGGHENTPVAECRCHNRILFLYVRICADMIFCHEFNISCAFTTHLRLIKCTC